jgi:hypothetical protein
MLGGPGNDLIRAGRGQALVSGDDGDDGLIDAYSQDSDCEQNLPPLGPNLGFPDRRCVKTGPIPVWYDFEDMWSGGPGNDLILGGAANDLISGDEGDDHLSGGPGGDAVSGGDGNDVCDGGEGDADTNSGEGYLPRDDCEQMTGFEPFGDPVIPTFPMPPTCDSEADPAGYEECLHSRVYLTRADWSPKILDVSGGEGNVDLDLSFTDPNASLPPPCDSCMDYPYITDVEVMLRSDAGTEWPNWGRPWIIDCRLPYHSRVATWSCSSQIPFNSGSAGTWKLDTIKVIFARGLFWSLYTEADLANPTLFPETFADPHATVVTG